MVKTSPLEKRIKRHVIAREHDFFAVTSPGSESICLDEIKDLSIKAVGLSKIKGGVEFRGKLNDCYLLNLSLRTANRILIRLCRFKATNFRQLEKNISNFPWELYLFGNIQPDIHVTSRHSRLYHKKAISDRFLSSIFTSLNNHDTFSDISGHILFFPQKVFIRVVDDQFTISLDSSGELLHKRGMKTASGKAPLRETTAAAVLKTANYDIKEPLIDPMCGTGTFSLEGAMIKKNMPPGWFRDFAFMGWPCFKQSSWKYLKQECEKKLLDTGPSLIFASDHNPENCSSLKKTADKYSLSDAINIQCQDFFDILPSDITDQTGLVVINPPYGIRLGTEQQSRNLYNAIWEKLSKDFHGWKTAVIVPHKYLLPDIPLELTSKQLFHGGLKLTLLTGRIKS